MSTENLSPMISVPYRERTLYIPQQSYGSESRTPDLMVKIVAEGTAITSSAMEGYPEYTQVHHFEYEIKRDVNSDASRNLHTNAQTFLSDVTFIIPAEPVLAQIITNLLKGSNVESIAFIEIQNAGDYNVIRETTTFTTNYFTHARRITSSWGGDARINVFACSFRSISYQVSLDAIDQATEAKGQLATGYDFGTASPIG